jgi:cytochrome P450
MLEAPIEDARMRKPSGLLGQLAHHRNDDGSKLGTREIAAHLLLLAWAGSDTTASASSWVLHVLAQRPDWQERLRGELLRANDDLEAVDSSKDCPAVDWMLLEIERMYPSVLFFPRVPIEDIEIYGHRIPTGTVLYYSPYLSGRDPDIFEHPNTFRPDRWDPALGKARVSPSKLVGFGGGPRVCLGKAFARTQLKLMMHATLTRYFVEPDPTATPKVMGLPIHHPVDSRIRLVPIH